MHYNPLIDLAILGAALIVVGLVIRASNMKPKGATPETDPRKLAEHQAVRRILMEEGEYK